LERTYLINLQEQDRVSFWRLGLTQVKAKLSEGLKKQLKVGVLQLIQLDRHDEKK